MIDPDVAFPSEMIADAMCFNGDIVKRAYPNQDTTKTLNVVTQKELNQPYYET